MATKPISAGAPSKETNTKVKILIGIKILMEPKIIFKPYNITNAKHIFLTTLITLFFISITVNYMCDYFFYDLFRNLFTVF